MKQAFLILCSFTILSVASAQFTAGINANYTMYKGDFKKSTPGIQIRLGYAATEKTDFILSFNYGMPIKQASSTILSDQNGNSASSVPSEIKYKFKTFNLIGHYNFIGDQESLGKFYGLAGIGLVLLKYDETVTGSYDKSAYTPANLLTGSESGFTINLGIGGEYNIGGPSLFGEAGLALPANTVNNQYVANVIPAHFLINLGVKINLTSAQ
ncbi:MAG TPA: hypothetical protein VGO09_04305 [Flavisolibacter sp.]|nr:hypothetical protein [Flavisolibacter sp.]